MFQTKTHYSSVRDEALALLANSNIPHFRRLLKKARHGHYSFKIAVTDIIDNVVLKAKRIHITVQFNEGKLYQIIISDDYVNGFENINDTGTANPMNWTHMREGQSHDSETSEYGAGLKEASCFLATIMRIFTRAVKNGEVSYREVSCNFDDMAEKENAWESHNISIVQTEDTCYQELHPFETGSTIILDGIRQFENMQFTNEQECIEILKTAIAETYSDILADRPELAIHVNGTRILPEHDHFRQVLQHADCIDRLITTTIVTSLQKINGETKIVKTMAKVCRSDETKYYDFNDAEPKPTKNAKEAVSLRESTTQKSIKECERMISDVNARKVIIYSTSTYGTDLDKSHIFKAAVRHKRSGRNYGDIQLINLKGSMSNDGYLNHVYHEMVWASKELNPFLGICSNKQIDPTRINPLTLSIRKLFGRLNNLLTSKKFSGDNDSDTNSVASLTSAISDITMNSTTSSKRRGRKPATTIISEPARRIASPIAASSSTSAIADIDIAHVIVQEPPNGNDSDIEKARIQPTVQELIDARLNETITRVEHTLAQQLLPLQNNEDMADDIHTYTATEVADPVEPQIIPLHQTNVIYTRITNQDRTYLTCKDAKAQLENLSTYADAHPSDQPKIVEDLMRVISTIADQRGKHLLLIDILKNLMTRGVTDDAHVVGGSKLVDIHAKYIPDNV